MRFRRARVDIVPLAVNRLLLPRERLVITLRMHPATMIPGIVVASGGALATYAVWPVVGGHRVLETAVLLFAGLLGAQLIRAITDWLTRYLVVTDLRILQCSASGVTWSVPMDEVKDVRLRRRFGARLLGYGTLIFDSAHLEVESVPYPEQMYLEILGLLNPDEGI